MKKIFLILYIFFLTSFTSNAFFGFDNFELPGVSTGSINGQGNIGGWVGPWSGTNGVQEIVNVTSDPLSLTLSGGILIDGGDQVLDIFGNSNIVAAREFQTPLTESLFFGFLMRFDSGTITGNDFVTFCFNSSAGCSYSNIPTIGLKANKGPGSTDFMVRNSPYSHKYSPTQIVAGETYYIVGHAYKSTGNPADRYDRFELWVNPDFTDSNILNNPDAVSTGLSGVSSIKYVGIRSATLGSSDSVYLDGITISDNWNDLNPISPPTITFLDDTESSVGTTDEINIKVSDIDGNPSTYMYGFVSSPSNCNSGATLNNSFSSEVTFTISDESQNGNYICAVAQDDNGSETFSVSANPINIDMAPIFDSITITSNNTNPLYAKSGDDIRIEIFLQNIDTWMSGYNKPTFDIGPTTGLQTNNYLGSFSGKISGYRTYTILDGQNGTFSFTNIDFRDLVGNDIVNFTPSYIPTTNVIVDTTKPVISSVLADITPGINNPILNFSGSDNLSGLDYWEIEIDGGTPIVLSGSTTTYTPSTLSGTWHTINFTLYDNAGNASDITTITFPPIVTINSPLVLSNTTITGSTVTITGPDTMEIASITASGALSGPITTCVPGLPRNVGVSGFTCDLGDIMSSGILEITAISSDGFTGSSNQSYVIDTLSPIITFSDDVDVNYSSSDNVEIQVSDPEGNADTSSFMYGFVSSPSDCNSGATLSNSFVTSTSFSISNDLENGNYICAVAEDIFGNITYASSTNPIKIDITNPVISISSPTKSSSGSITDTTITITDNAGILFSDITATGGTLSCSQVSITEVSCTSTISVSGDLEIQAQDSSGNISSQTESSYIIDNIAPFVGVGTGILVTMVNESVYPVTGYCTVGDGDVSISIGVPPSIFTGTTICDGTGEFSLDFDLSSFTDGNISVEIDQTDFLGNTGTSSGSITKDTSAPSINSIGDLVTTQNTAISSIPVVVSSTGATITVSGLPSGLTYNSITGEIEGTSTVSGVYTIIIRATNSLGNYSEISFNITVNSDGTSTGGGSSYVGGNGEGSISSSNQATIGNLPNDPNVTIGSIEEKDNDKKSEKINSSDDNENNEDKLDLNSAKEKDVYEDGKFKEVIINGEKRLYSLKESNCKIIDNILEDNYKKDYKTKFEDISGLTEELKTDIIRLEKTEIVKGRQVNLFEPDGKITRAEFLAIVLQAHCYDVYKEATKLPFTDMQNLDTWQSRVVQVGYENGIISGYKDGTFRPNESISKIEAFAIMMKMREIELLKKDVKDSYVDKQAKWQEKPLGAGEYLGILKPKDTDYKFNPDGVLSRKEMVKIMIDIMKLY